MSLVDKTGVEIVTACCRAESLSAKIRQFRQSVEQCLFLTLCGHVFPPDRLVDRTRGDKHVQDVFSGL